MASPDLSSEAPAVSFVQVSYDIPPKRNLKSSIKGLIRREASDVEAPAPGSEVPPLGASRILRSVSGCVRRGESLAVIGPSGAGKSSLLNLLAGRAQHPVAGGRIEFDGRKRDSRTKRRIGYCTQDDIFFSKLTVRETLQFTSAIRLEGKMGAEERKRCVDAIVTKLRLGKCLDTRIGDAQFDKGISGGERKRLNIANELLGTPDGGILLLDEPTSGLESAGALTVVRLLRQLADEGHAIVSTIHQPTSLMWSLFDSVLLLSEGEVAYFGPTSAALDYFASIGFPIPSNYNPADYIMQLLIEDDMYAPPGGGRDSNAEETAESNGSGTSLTETGTSTDGEDGDKKSRELARYYLTRRWRDLGEDFLARRWPNALEGIGGPMQDTGTGAEEAVSRRNHGGRLVAELQGKCRVVEKRMRDITGAVDPTGLGEKYATSWFAQVRVLALRATRQKRGALLEGIQLSQLASIIVICALFWFRMDTKEAALEDRVGSLFFVPVFFAFFSTFSALFAFPFEKAVLNKDRSSGAYRLSAYYFAKTCVEVPADMIYPIMFSIVVYWANNLNPKFDRFFGYCVVLVFNTLAAQSLGLFISAAMMDVRQSQVVASSLILIFMLIGGFYVDRDNIPTFLKPFRHLSFIKFGFAALVRNEMQGRSFTCVPAGAPSTVYSDSGTRCPISGADVLRGAQLDDSLSVAGNLGILFVWFVLLRFAGYFALKYMHRPHKERNFNQ